MHKVVEWEKRLSPTSEDLRELYMKVAKTKQIDEKCMDEDTQLV